MLHVDADKDADEDTNAAAGGIAIALLHSSAVTLKNLTNTYKQDTKTVHRELYTHPTLKCLNDKVKLSWFKIPQTH